ncbi:hypothetical protein CAEBREN_09719 [Caenorhabditis brenneri]|uniref:Uncharacterized protein n=1 Tax=Caenorhabditis brenneri TaxID=135651 RepID=G0MVV6_CAEBE|nr:hypothetical protein CAEBREN_09719 [Caenorhabditis brenneri]
MLIFRLKILNFILETPKIIGRKIQKFGLKTSKNEAEIPKL